MKKRIYYVEYITFPEIEGKGYAIKPVIKVTKHLFKAVIVWLWYKWIVRNHAVLKTEVVRLHRYDYLLGYNVRLSDSRRNIVKREYERYSSMLVARIHYWAKCRQEGIEDVRIELVSK